MARSITFHGAAGTVTGSCHLLELDGKKILVDCGIFQGNSQTRDLNYEPFHFDPRELDAVILTHAHQDHIGRLPKLVKDGYHGPIYATQATLGLCRISLPDSARIQEEDARHARRHGSRHENPMPLYTEEDAYASLKLVQTKPYHTWIDLPGGAVFRFHQAGHILGSTFAEITLPDGERILMGGDLGRYNTPIIKDPDTIDAAEYLVIESTYGDRIHSGESPLDKIELMIRYVMQTGGALLIPSFSIGRTQEMLYYFRKLQNAGRIPRIPIFIDSPMAISATNLYAKSKEEHDQDMLISLEEGRSELEPDGLTMIRDKEESKALNSRPGPMVIIAGSGMVNGGRIQHHILHRIEDPATAILFTGYQAEGTIGRRLLEGITPINLLRREVNVRARIEKANALSAHADQHEIMKWLHCFKQAPKKKFVIHGEPHAREALAARIREELGWNLELPEMHESFPLG